MSNISRGFSSPKTTSLQNQKPQTSTKVDNPSIFPKPQNKFNPGVSHNYTWGSFTPSSVRISDRDEIPKGTIISKNGDTFTGEVFSLLNDKTPLHKGFPLFSGYGTMTYAAHDGISEGSNLSGSFSSGHIDIYEGGTYTYKDREQKQIFTITKELICTEDGPSFERSGKVNAEGTFYMDNRGFVSYLSFEGSTKYEGKMINNRLQGHVTVWDSKGKLEFSGHYSNGERMYGKMQDGSHYYKNIFWGIVGFLFKWK